MGDALVAARRRGVRLLARMDFSKVSGRIAAEHPDWVFVSAAGRRQEYNGLVSVCPSGPYYQQRAFDVLDEFATRYPVDGFFFNWMSFNEVDYSGVYYGPCHCSHCQQAFAAFAPGATFPDSTEGDDYLAWRAFVTETLDALTARFRDRIATLLPEAGLILGERADIMFHEANSKVGREFWPHATSQAVSVSKSREPDVPVLVNSAVFVDMPYRFAPINDDHYATYFIQTMARGGIPSTYTMGTPAAAPYANLPVAGELTRHHRDHEDVYRGLRQAATTLLVMSSGRRSSSWWLDQPDDEFRGAYEALVRAHIPFDVGTAHDLTRLLEADRARWAVVVLCDVGPLGAAAANMLDDWVRAGGRVVGVGGSGIDASRIECATSPALRCTATDDDAQRLLNTYVAAPTPGIGDGFDRRSAVSGAYHFLELADDAERRLTLLAQSPYGPPEKCYGTIPTGFPGVALRHTGNGIHAVVPWSIGRTSRLLGTAASGQLLADLVDELEGDRSVVRADLPEQAEIVVGENERGLVVHVVNYTGVQRNSIGSPVTITGGTLQLRGPHPTAARALVAGTELPIREQADGIVVTLPDVARFEVVEIVRT